MNSSFIQKHKAETIVVLVSVALDILSLWWSYSEYPNPEKIKSIIVLIITVNAFTIRWVIDRNFNIKNLNYYIWFLINIIPYMFIFAIIGSIFIYFYT